MRIAVLVLSVLLVMSLGAGAYGLMKINTDHDIKRTLEDEITSARAEIVSLQRIVNLQEKQTIINGATINQTAGQTTEIAKFTAQYAGYLTVSGTSTTTNGFVLINSTQYNFGTGTTFHSPILPGDVSIAFGNTNIFNGATATLTVTYIY